MKKNFLFALIAVLTLGLASCDPIINGPVGPDNNGNGGNGNGNGNGNGGGDSTGVIITVSPETLNLSVGDEERLKAVITPAGTAVKITWTSSDESVATVSSTGLVEAIGEGMATITASAEGATAGTCEVTVSNTAAYDNFTVAGFGFFGQDVEYIDGTDTVLTLSDGSYNVKLGYIYLRTWDGNLVYVNGQGFAGTGFGIIARVALWWIVGGDFDGYYIGSANGYSIDNLDFPAFGHGEIGWVDVNKLGDFWHAYMTQEDLTDADLDNLDNGYGGAAMYYIDATTEQTTVYDVCPVALVKDMALYEGENDIYYDATITWFDFLAADRWFGYKVVTEEIEGENYITGLVQPYDFNTIEKHFTAGTAPEEAPKYFKSNKNLYKVAPFANKKAISTTKFHKK